MATESVASVPSKSQLEDISRLRGIAEKHLHQIAEERLQEQFDDAKRNEELERYAKQRRRAKLRATSPAVSTPTSRMRSAQDVLERLKWDDSLDLSKYIIGYLERFNGIQEMPATRWISEPTEEEWIPQHRIRYFKQVDESGKQSIVWDRDNRIDKIFGASVNKEADNDDRWEDSSPQLTH
ncbi:hypothetical protein PV08_03480 [Exophiala spinifera]|uniref:MJ1316 RNA cyclic group end recognition domain-containing protein n=1 Tax=Exophiala spinifera TaxID=91928 RepID=A0A0D1YV67_9EURO|nr:uncharacterized protein PV08_03480 [Exophiala spinifera]KIW19186.1 hypothetical protein PV08_03480 [Exophiala spinifera]